jgi:hypothetical protein
MRESYSVSLIQFTLTHWWDIRAGQLTTEQMSEYTRSIGRRNPRETAYIWMADVANAIGSLRKPYDPDTWSLIYHDLGAEGARMQVEKLGPAQRYVIKNCIFGECGAACQKLKREARGNCREIGAVLRMRRFLNGEEYEPPKQQQRALDRGRAEIIKAMSRAINEAETNLTEK